MIRIHETENVREVWDDENQRLYQKHYRCWHCKEWIDFEDEVWIDNKAFHVECAPNQY